MSTIDDEEGRTFIEVPSDDDGKLNVITNIMKFMGDIELAALLRAIELEQKARKTRTTEKPAKIRKGGKKKNQ